MTNDERKREIEKPANASVREANDLDEISDQITALDERKRVILRECRARAGEVCQDEPATHGVWVLNNRDGSNDGVAFGIGALLRMPLFTSADLAQKFLSCAFGESKYCLEDLGGECKPHRVSWEGIVQMINEAAKTVIFFTLDESSPCRTVIDALLTKQEVLDTLEELEGLYDASRPHRKLAG